MRKLSVTVITWNEADFVLLCSQVVRELVRQTDSATGFTLKGLKVSASTDRT